MLEDNNVPAIIFALVFTFAVSPFVIKFVRWVFDEHERRNPPPPIPPPAFTPPIPKVTEAPGPFPIPDQTRFEHTWILGPPGSGKTQTIQYLVSRDIEKECSVLVMDSQGDLIKQIATLASIQHKVILIQPDTIALNPFQLKGEQAVDLLTYVFGALGDGATLTPKQTSLYRYCIRLLQEIPGATLKTFLQILQPEGVTPYRKHFTKLSEPARLFFESQFDDPKQYRETKQEVSWRLMFVLENPTFERMFCAPHSKLNLFEELNTAKVICIDTSKETLGSERSGLFGRFFIALLLLASQQRASLPLERRLPVFAFIDEAQEYLSDNKLTEILDQARKMKIGLTLANQRSQQITNANALDALLTTAIKYVHTDNDRDTHLLARPMSVVPEFLARQPKGFFAHYVRGFTTNATSIKIPFFVLENMEHVPLEPLQARMKAKYGPDKQVPTAPIIDEPPTDEATKSW